jgi:hypothetical protein
MGWDNAILTVDEKKGDHLVLWIHFSSHVACLVGQMSGHGDLKRTSSSK